MCRVCFYLSLFTLTDSSYSSCSLFDLLCWFYDNRFSLISTPLIITLFIVSHLARLGKKNFAFGGSRFVTIMVKDRLPDFRQVSFKFVTSTKLFPFFSLIYLSFAVFSAKWLEGHNYWDQTKPNWTGYHRYPNRGNKIRTVLMEWTFRTC